MALDKCPKHGQFLKTKRISGVKMGRFCSNCEAEEMLARAKKNIEQTGKAVPVVRIGKI